MKTRQFGRASFNYFQSHLCVSCKLGKANWVPRVECGTWGTLVTEDDRWLRNSQVFLVKVRVTVDSTIIKSSQLVADTEKEGENQHVISFPPRVPTVYMMEPREDHGYVWFNFLKKLFLKGLNWKNFKNIIFKRINLYLI